MEGFGPVLFACAGAAWLMPEVKWHENTCWEMDRQLTLVMPLVTRWRWRK